MNKINFGLFIILFVCLTSTYCQNLTANNQTDQKICNQTNKLRLSIEKKIHNIKKINVTYLNAEISKHEKTLNYMNSVLDFLSPQTVQQQIQKIIQKNVQKPNNTQQKSSNGSNGTQQKQNNTQQKSKNVQQESNKAFNQLNDFALVLCKRYKQFQTKQQAQACKQFEILKNLTKQNTDVCQLARSYHQESLVKRIVEGEDKQLICQTVHIIGLTSQIKKYLSHLRSVATNEKRIKNLNAALDKVRNSQRQQHCLLTRFVRVERGTKGSDCLQISQLQVFNAEGKEVAYKQKAYASSQWEANSGPQRAVDGDARNRNHPYEFHIGGTQCKDPKAFWEVDLGESHIVNRVVYYNRADCCSQRSVGLLVSLLDKNRNVINKYNLKGGMIETIQFDN